MFHTSRLLGAKRSLAAPAVMLAGALFLTSCAGSAGQAEVGSGFEYGADQEEVNSVLEELQPATITMQAGAASPNSHWAKAPQGFAAAIEERSNGKLTVDVVYGQPIAPFAEVDNALADGRIDVGLMIPQYDQATYPAFHALASSLFGQPSSPVVGDAAHQGQVLELAWGSEEILTDYEEQGLVPLVPSVNAGTYALSCTQAADEAGDWQGRMVRVSGRYVETAVRAIGANPVSMDLTEVYEGLQRNAIDCTASQPLTTVDAGTLEVAPHLMLTPEESSLSTRAGAALMAGAGFKELPLAYQQIVFDATQDYLAANMGLLVDARADAYGIVSEEGGSVQMLDEETAERITSDNAQQLASIVDSSPLGDDWAKRVAESGAEWRSALEELGYSDEGADEDLATWYERGSVDFGPAATKMFEEASLEHRPN
jgi:TRAP-type C4-dicarboxylate transport system substrate-binding protein